MSATETAASIIESKEGNGAGALRRNATRASGGKPVNVIKVDIHCVTSAYQQDSEKNNFDETCHNFKPGSSEFAARCKEFDNCSVVYRFIKRLFDITFSLCVVVVGLIPCLVLCGAIMLDTKGSPIYTQERIGWSIIGQKSGAVSDYPVRPALSALEVLSTSHSQLRLGVVA